MEEFRTIENQISAEIVEKRSKFIGNLFYVESKEEAKDILMRVKKEHRDARHNCFAYRIIDNNIVIERSSDDGEPRTEQQVLLF